MTWVFFCKKVENRGCLTLFVKKVENGGCFFVKKWKMGVFFCKKWTFPQRRVHYAQYQYFFILHFTYLGGGTVRTKRTSLPAGLAAAACGGFATGRRCRSIAARRAVQRAPGAVASSTAVSSKCEQCHVYSRRTRPNTDLV